ncbi:MAG TPA: dTDP-4-dehydrorhamnose reductase [Bradyrhizobium sp.]|jgi:dTDP-4-dehydrorhamnose reductase
MGLILIFGAAGQVGRELAGLAKARNIGLRAVTHEDVDIVSPDAVARIVEQTRPHLIVNAAAYTAVDRAEQERERAEAVNAGGAENVALFAARAEVPLLHLSTDYVFDGTKHGSYVEADAVAPLGVYGATKLRGEVLVRAANRDAIIVRTAWVYGQYGNNFLKTVLRLATSRDRLQIVGDQHGCPTATLDIAEAILAVDRAILEGRSYRGIFHFAGDGATTWHGFAEAIVDCQAKWTHRRPAVEAITTAEYAAPAPRPANSRLDSGLFARTFGYRAKPWQVRTREIVDILLTKAIG